MLRPVQQRISKGDAVRLQLVDAIGYHQSLIFVQRRRVRKEGSGVGLRSQPEQDQIEDGVVPKRRLDLLLIAFCGFICAVFSADAMDISLGTKAAWKKRL